ncbi:MAG: hypothetical protein ACE5DI_06425, partial [Candidatus Micrarchaeia archaeon]
MVEKRFLLSFVLFSLFSISFFSFDVSACASNSDCDCRSDGAVNCDSNNPFGRCDLARSICVYCTDGIDNDNSGTMDCQEPWNCPASRYIACASGEVPMCRAGEASYGSSSALKWTAGWNCELMLSPSERSTVVPFENPSCSLSVSPPFSVEAGSPGRVQVTVDYAGFASSLDFILINCGNGRFSTAYNCQGNAGSCSAYCYYPHSGSFSVKASAGQTSCSAASVTARSVSVSCGDGV